MRVPDGAMPSVVGIADDADVHIVWVRLRRSDVRLTFRRPLETTTPDQFQS